MPGGLHAGGAERACEDECDLLQLVGRGAVAGVVDHDELAARQLQPDVAGLGLGHGVAVGDHDHAEVVGQGQLLQGLRRRRVVLLAEQEDLEAGAGVVESGQALDQAGQPGGLVVQRHQHRVDRQHALVDRRDLRRADLLRAGEQAAGHGEGPVEADRGAPRGDEDDEQERGRRRPQDHAGDQGEPRHHRHRALARGDQEVGRLVGTLGHAGGAGAVQDVVGVQAQRQPLDLDPVGEHDADRPRQVPLQGVLLHRLERPGRGDHDVVPGVGDGHGTQPERGRERQPQGQRRVRLDAVEADPLEIVRLGQDGDVDVLGDGALGQQDLAERVAGAQVLLVGPLQLGVGDQSAAQQHLGDPEAGTARERRLGSGAGPGVGRVDRGQEVVRVVRDQPHGAGQPLGDHVRGHVVVGVGGGHEQHAVVGDGVGQHPERAAPTLGQQVPDVGVDPRGQGRDGRGERGGGHVVALGPPDVGAWEAARGVAEQRARGARSGTFRLAGPAPDEPTGRVAARDTQSTDIWTSPLMSPTM